MVLDQSFRRMTLRQLLTLAEKCSRDLQWRRASPNFAI